MGRNVSLDFFRGFAAILVCIGHFFYWNNLTEMFPLSFILAVDFFLVLSGFVIAQSVLNKKNFSAIDFAKKRWLRLFPVFIVCYLFFLIPKILIGKDNLDPNAVDIFKVLIIGNMLPFNLNSNFPDLLAIAYTISAELYVGIIIFPIVYYFYSNKTELAFPFLIITILVTFVVMNRYSTNYMDIHYELYNNIIPFGIIRCILDYSIGILFYMLYSSINMDDCKDKFNNIVQICIIFILLFLFSYHSYNRNNEFIAPFIFGLFILSISFKNGIIYKITNNSFGVFLGNISYPIYLIHPFVITLFLKLKLEFSLITLLPYLVLCILISFILNKYVEKPCLKLLK